MLQSSHIRNLFSSIEIYAHIETRSWAKYIGSPRQPEHKAGFDHEVWIIEYIGPTALKTRQTLFSYYTKFPTKKLGRVRIEATRFEFEKHISGQ